MDKFTESYLNRITLNDLFFTYVSTTAGNLKLSDLEIFKRYLIWNTQGIEKGATPLSFPEYLEHIEEPAADLNIDMIKELNNNDLKNYVLQNFYHNKVYSRARVEHIIKNNSLGGMLD